MLDINNKPYLEEFGKKYTPEEKGWVKELIFKGIFAKEPFQEHVKGRAKGITKTVMKYSYRVYKVKSGTCRHCKSSIEREKINDSMCRIRKASLKSGLFRRCFLGIVTNGGKSQDFTDMFMDYGNDYSNNFKLLSETGIDANEALELYKNGDLDYIADSELIHMLEAKLDVNF